MTVLVETVGGLVRKIDDATWAVESGIDTTRYPSAGEALIALSNHCETWSRESDYTVDYKVDIDELQGMVEAAGGTELFTYSDNGWILRDGWWLPACVDPGIGDAEREAELIADTGDMGIHVELFDYCGIYFLRWVVVDHDDSGLEVLGAIDQDAALARADAKADELGGSHGLQKPFAIGLANLSEDARFALPNEIELVAQASTAWPYDPSVKEEVTIYRTNGSNDTRWLVTAKDQQTVIGTYPTWRELRDAAWAPDGWEIELELLIDEPVD